MKKTYVSGQLDETRHFFYTDPSRWQVVEERVGTSTNADRQFVWGLRYVDDLILRDRDTNSDGTLDERLYGMQDANWNVTSIADAHQHRAGTLRYHPYGTPIVLTGVFTLRGLSSFDWEAMFAGLGFDAGSGLYHVRTRWLDPNVAGWIGRDPLGLSSGTNFYQYCSSNPANETDPTGRIPIIGPIVVILVIVSIVAALIKYWHCKKGIAFCFRPLASDTFLCLLYRDESGYSAEWVDIYNAPCYLITVMCIEDLDPHGPLCLSRDDKTLTESAGLCDDDSLESRSSSCFLASCFLSQHWQSCWCLCCNG